MRNQPKLKILLYFAFFLCTIQATAQNRNFNIQKTLPSWLQRVNVSEKRPAARDIQDGYYLFLYELQTNLETQEEYTHVIREIVSDNGVQNGSEISVTFDPSYEKLTFNKVIIWRNNRPIDKLQASNFKVIQNEKELSKFIYSGTFDAYQILDDVRKGDRIEYAFTLKGANPVFKNKYSSTFYFEGDSQIANIYNAVIAKKERVLQIKNFNRVPKVKIQELDGLKIYEWQEQLTKTIKSEDHEPSWFDPYGRIQLSEFKSWKEIVDWSIQLNTYDLNKAISLKAKITELKKRSKGNATIYFELATRFVQDEIRYMGIEMGEYSHRPNSPEKVLKQRYGDCKDKSLLLISLLQGNGIQAYPVYINTYLREKSKELLPTTGAFDHAVVMVEFKGKKIWIDATMTDQRGSITDIYFPYNANVLVIKPGNDRLEFVKSNPTGKLSSFSTIKVPDTTDRNKAGLTIKSTYTANYADNLRSEISSSGVNKLEKDFLEYYEKLYPGIAKVNDIEIADNEKSNTITLTETYEIENIWVKDDSVAAKFDIYFYADMVDNEIRTINKARNTPFALKYPVNVSQVIKIILPEKWRIDDDKVEINRSGYHFSSTTSYQSDTLTLAYDYQNLQTELSGDTLKQYVKDYNNSLRYLKYHLYSNHNSGSASNSTLNFWLILLSLFIWLVAVITFAILYTRKGTFDFEEIKNLQPIGGWLILLGIGCSLSPFLQIYTTYSSSIFDQKMWDNLTNFGKNGEILMKLAVIGECITNTVLMAYSFFVAILFFNRRKLFVQYYVALRILSVLVVVLDLIMMYYIRTKIDIELNLFTELSSILWKIIFAAIWITYVLKSDRVKRTFVLTYPNFEWRNALIRDFSQHINIPFPSDLDQHTQNFNNQHQQEDNEKF